MKKIAIAIALLAAIVLVGCDSSQKSADNAENRTKQLDEANKKMDANRQLKPGEGPGN